ncbi:hypothetical protein LTR16_007166, partial [Cryomyces antarcticus]
ARGGEEGDCRRQRDGRHRRRRSTAHTRGRGRGRGRRRHIRQQRLDGGAAEGERERAQLCSLSRQPRVAAP